ncbi:hypothetical protein BDR05DRAFT_953765 [Suillus weaverae]|nr:hypothetical protein BDR05DRAFT_953765 [Suillus weaverae]
MFNMVTYYINFNAPSWGPAYRLRLGLLVLEMLVKHYFIHIKKDSESICDEAASYVIQALGGEELAKCLVGGTKWWQVRGVKGLSSINAGLQGLPRAAQMRVIFTSDLQERVGYIAMTKYDLQVENGGSWDLEETSARHGFGQALREMDTISLKDQDMMNIDKYEPQFTNMAEMNVDKYEPQVTNMDMYIGLQNLVPAMQNLAGRHLIQKWISLHYLCRPVMQNPYDPYRKDMSVLPV